MDTIKNCKYLQCTVKKYDFSLVKKKTETGKQNMFSVTTFFIYNLFHRFIELFQKGRTTLLHSSKVNFEQRSKEIEKLSS